jgi:hypothetical protein
VSLNRDGPTLHQEGAPVKTILLLEDGSRQAKLMLQDPAHTMGFVRETEAVANCNCDRWGHPSPGCVNDNARNKAARPFSLPLDD